MIDYLIKSTLWLAVFYLGYLLVAREKRFQFNRLYLLAALLFSLIYPLIPVSFDFGIAVAPDESHRLFRTSLPVHSHLSTTLTHTEKDTFSFSQLSLVLYGLGFAFMLYRFLNNLLSLSRMKEAALKIQEEGYLLALTDSNNIAPFTFGRWIFLSKDDYVNGRIDPAILWHERVHVTHRHSLDILLVEFLLLFYWFNPLLWAYRRAIRINHEYMADQEVIRSQDLSAYAEALISAAQTHTVSFFGSRFTYLLTKKRLLMMNRLKTSGLRFGYKVAGTFLVLFLSFLVLSFKPVYQQNPADQDFVVVIDASHGGNDAGAFNKDLNIAEKELVLAISRALKRGKNSSGIMYHFTRENDQAVSLEDRVAMINRLQADLVISLHVNSNENTGMNGLEVYFSEQNAAPEKSKLYSERFMEGLSLGKNATKTLGTANFAVLKDVNCAAVLVNVGFISNEQDATFLKDTQNQQQVARQIDRVLAEISRI